MLNLQDAVRLISSEKATERSLGIEQYKRIFHDDETLARFAEGDDGEKRWLRTLQALFNCVIADRSTCVRRGSWQTASPVSKKRLQDSAGMVLWMIERCHTYLEKQALTSALNHLTQMIDFRGELVEIISIYYLKALTILLNYVPHIDHLDLDQWKFCTNLCFNVILRQHLSSEVDYEDAKILALKSCQASLETHTKSFRIRPDDLQAAKCLHALTRADHAPLVNKERHGAMVLFRFVCILLEYPQESSLHLPVLEGIVHTLNELRVNDMETMIQIGELAWTSLLNLWGSRSQAVKEQVILAFRTLAPVMQYCKKVELLETLCEEILGEGEDRLSIRPLRQTCIDLRSITVRGPFQYPHFQASNRIETASLLSWSTLELGADLITFLHDTVSEESSQSDTHPTPSKRRKVRGRSIIIERGKVLGKVFEPLVDQGRSSSSRTIWQIQLLLFLIARASDQLKISAQEEIIQALVKLLNGTDAEVASWAFIALASATSYPSFQQFASNTLQIASRQILRGSICRSAAHLLQTIIRSRYVDKAELSTALSSILPEMELQHVPQVCDATSAFVCQALLFLRSNVALTHSSVHSSAFAWFRQAWQIPQILSLQRRAETLFHEMSSDDVTNLILATSGHSDNDHSVLPPFEYISCATTSWTKSYQSQKSIEKYVLDGKIDPDKQASKVKEKPISQFSQEADSEFRHLNTNEARGIHHLHFMMKKMMTMLEEARSASMALTYEQYRDLTELSMSNLKLQAFYRTIGVKTVSAATKLAFALLQECINSLKSSQIPLAQKAAVIDLINCSISKPKYETEQHIIQPPGRQAGVHKDKIFTNSNQIPRLTASLKSLRDLWNSEQASPIVLGIKDMLLKMCTKSNDDADQSLNDDFLSDIAQRSNLSEIYAQHISDETRFMANACLKFLLSVSMVRMANDELIEIHLEALHDELSTDIYIEFLKTTNLCAPDGKSFLDVQMQERVIERIGTDVLATYAFERNIEGQMVVIDFLRNTMSSWLSVSALSSKRSDRHIQLCQFFIRQFNKNHLHWTVECAFACLMEHLIYRTIEKEGIEAHLSKSLKPQSIIKSLCILNGRADMRVRFPSSSLLGRLFDLWETYFGETNQLYKHQESSLPLCREDQSQMASRILTLANICVSSALIRQYSFFHLLEVCMVMSPHAAHGRNALQLVSCLLGYADTTKLWASFAHQLVCAMVLKDYTLDQIPIWVLGYESHKEWAEDTYIFVVAPLVTHSRPAYEEAFSKLCHYLDRRKKDVIFACLPDIIAYMSIEYACQGNQLSHLQAHLSTWADSKIKGEYSSNLIDSRLKLSIDTIVVRILQRWYEPDRDEMDSQIANRFPKFGKMMSSLPLQRSNFRLLELEEPRVGSEQLLTLLSSLSSPKMNVDSVEVVFNVLNQLGSILYEEQSLDTQLRLLCALHIYVSMTWPIISETPILLRSLFQVCLACLHIQDLVEHVAPILCLCIRSVTEDVQDFATMLVIACEKLLIHSGSIDIEMRAKSNSVLEYIEQITLQLYDTDVMRPYVRIAFCAWPREHPASIIDVLSLNLADLTRAIHEVDHINVQFLNRFAVALRDKDDGIRVQFASTAFWKIIELLQSEKNVTEDQMSQFMAALAEITFQCDGMLPSPSVKTLQESIASEDLLRYVREIPLLDEKSENMVLPLQQWLTVFLLKKTHSLNLCEAKDAACTLRNIFKQDPNFNRHKRQKGSKLRIWENELDYIISFDPQRVTKVVMKENQLFGDQAYQRATNVKSWTPWLCQQLFYQLEKQDASLPYIHLGQIINAYDDIAQQLLPCIVHLFLRQAKSKRNEKGCKTLSLHLTDILRYDKADPAIWKIIIQIVLHLREDPPHSLPFSGDVWIDKMDWLLLASRAAQVQLFSSALLFLELQNQYSPSIGDPSTSLDLQYAIYSNIEDPDSFYGIHNENVRDSLSRRMEHEGQWEGVFSLQAAELEHSNGAKMRQKIVSTLHQMRYDRFALEIKVEEDQIDYETGWRTLNWDLPVQTSIEMSAPSQGLYSALRSLHEMKDFHFVQKSISTAFASQFRDLGQINVESSKLSQNTLRTLIGLREVQTRERDGLNVHKHSQMDFDIFESLMSVKCSTIQAERKHTSTQALGEVSLDESDESIILEGNYLLLLSQRAREEGKTQIAINAVMHAQHLASQLNESQHKFSIEEEFAKVLWMQGNHAIASDALSALLQKLPTISLSISEKKRKAQSLSTLGQWRVTARSHHSHAIVSECFRPSLGLLDSIKAAQEAAEVAYRYGIFADDQYRELCASPEARRLERMLNDRQSEIGELESEIAKLGAITKGPKASALRQAKHKAQVILEADVAALSEHEKSKDRFRHDAVEMFVRELSASGRINDDALMRLTSLWFENSRNEAFNQKLTPMIKRIPSWKFIPIVRQLCSRLSKDSSLAQQGASRSSSPAFQETVFDVVLNLAKDHPFHALYPLYALSRGSKEANQGPHSRRRGQRISSTTTFASATQTERSDIASDIINRARIGSRHKERIQAWQSVCDACVEWAQVDLPTAMPKEFGAQKGNETSVKGKGKGKANTHPRIPQHLRIHKLRDLNVPIVTKHLPIEPSATYKSFVGIVRYADHFFTAGGIHLPKITDCIGSDGKVYRQLFKDQDDLRQDAVMQQVFNLVNSMLKQDRRANKRYLHVRTYGVVPLGPQYGLLEFVGNTVPLLKPLQQLYARHHVKGQFTPSEAREEMAKCRGKTIEEKRMKFEDVCERMPPIFRFYFLHMYTNPTALLQSRLNYTRTVATSSIVGHILGLGDRHSSNILLDQRNGEVIHIDFGVAFDQGKFLPIPELVPFRLTRNVIDGMGLNGVEGVFRHGCQETLRVLRGGASVIKTVLEVFKNDPLYDWTQSPIKVIRAQGYDDNESESLGESQEKTINGTSRTSTTISVTNGAFEGARQSKELAELAAERAINSTMEKLSNNLSVEYTVNALMTKAMDPSNLGAIFDGWQAAL